MAFPSVVARATHVSATSNSTLYAPAPSLPGTAGDLLVAIVSSDGNPTLSAQPTDGNDWTKLGQASNGTAVTGAVFFKIAEQANFGTPFFDDLAISSSGSEQFSSIFLRIAGSNLQIDGAHANGSSTNSNPPNLSSATDLLGLIDGSARDYLWIAARSGDSTVVATAAPASFSQLQTRAAAGTGGASTNTAERALNAAAQDPGTFTSASEQWVSWTLAVWAGAVTPVYRGAAGKAAVYKGIRSDAQLYRGAGQLWP